MILGERFLVVFLITTIGVPILHAAPQTPPEESPGTPPSSADPPTASADPPAASAGSPPSPQQNPGETPTSSTPAGETAEAVGSNKPAKPSDSKPAEQLTDPNTAKPSKPTSENPKPSAEHEETDEASNNCWSCLLDAAEELCSYIMGFTGSSKFPAVSLFSIFQGRSSEESAEGSSEGSDNSDDSSISLFSNIFRYRRSLGRFRRAVHVRDNLVQSAPVQGFEGVPVEEEAFLKLLHGFYLKMRNRFLRENPGTTFPGIVDLYKRPGELVQVAAYVLGVPRERLVQVYDRLQSKETGVNLWRALDDRMAVLTGEQRNMNSKTFGNLTPTNISYFLQELLASVNGIATGFTELLSIGIPNQPSPTNQAK